MKSMNFYECAILVMMTTGIIIILLDAEAWSALIASKVVGGALVALAVRMFKVWKAEGKINALTDISE